MIVLLIAVLGHILSKTYQLSDWGISLDKPSFEIIFLQ